MKKLGFLKFMQKKLVLLFMIIMLVFLILICRITYINAVSGSEYQKKVLDQQEYNSQTIAFKRGDILDRNGTKLATSERVYNVILDNRVLLSKKTYKEPTLKALAEFFELNRDELEKLVKEKPTTRYNVLKKDVPYETASKFNKALEDTKKYGDVQGVWLEEGYQRSYPYNTLASDVIGFTVDGNVGNNGIESTYNSVLNGTDGREYGYKDDDSTYNTTVKEAINGQNVVTTIDLQVQSIVEKYMKQFNDEHKGDSPQGQGSKNTAVMVMNPQNGEILAEASYPNYDLNQPRNLDGLYTKEEQGAMSKQDELDNLNSLWNNFCVSTTYEPGSTFKPFLVSEALDSGVLNGNESFNCTGSLNVGGHTIHCSHRSGHGVQTLKEALANSCNVAMMQIAEKMDKERFVKMQEMFGFGQTTGIDLPGEEGGLLYNVDNMDVASLATNGFGQNFTVNMTQLAAAYCSLINGGEYYQPHIVKQLQDENGTVTENKNPVLQKRTLSPEISATIKDYMHSVVTDGTGKAAAVAGYDVGGKTGTAEKLPRGNGKYLVSFIGYAPQENPEVMVYVVIDEPNVASQSTGGYASIMAANIFKEILPYLGVPKAAGNTGE